MIKIIYIGLIIIIIIISYFIVRMSAICRPNREIVGIFIGSVPRPRVQSECLCPGQYPLEQGLNCFENNPGSAIGGSVPRVSQSSHTLEMANDGDLSTYFLTNPVEGIKMELDLGDEFEVWRVNYAIIFTI